MDVLPTIILGVVVAVVGALVAFLSRGQYKDLVHRMDRYEDQVETRFGKVDDRFDKVDDRFDKVDARFERLEAKIDAIDLKLDSKIDVLRADLTQLAFRLGDRPQPQTG